MSGGIHGRDRARAGARLAARVAVACLLGGLVACVSNGKYEKLAAERDALRRQVAGLEREKQGLASRVDEHKDELSTMKGTYDGLLAELKNEVAAGQVQIERMRDGIRVNLAQDILFPTGSADLDAQGRDVLTRVSEQLAKARHRIEVEGHTDNVPIRGALAQTYPSNWELAGARAARVVRLFEEKGVDEGLLTAVSFGEMHPVASNADAEGRARNRRIEIRLLPEADETLPAEIDSGWNPS